MNYKTYGKLDRAFSQFDLNKAWQLRDDVVAELTDGSLDMSDADRAYTAWFLRNYIFLPVTLITEMLEYGKDAHTWRAIERITEHALTPASLDGTFIDGGCLRELEVLVKEYYTFVRTGVYLDRLDSETAEFMLYQMSKLVGYSDKNRNGGAAKPYESTPQSLSSRAALCEVISLWEQGESLDSIDEQFIIEKL